MERPLKEEAEVEREDLGVPEEQKHWGLAGGHNLDKERESRLRGMMMMIQGRRGQMQTMEMRVHWPHLPCRRGTAVMEPPLGSLGQMPLERQPPLPLPTSQERVVFFNPCDQETGSTNEEIGGCRSSIASCDREFGNTRDGDSRPRCAGSMNDRQRPTNVFTGLTVIHSNCQSAMNKRSEILDLVNNERPHVLALTEFGASGDMNDGELGIDGYTLYRGDHSDGKGGLGRGVALPCLQKQLLPAKDVLCENDSYFKIRVFSI